MENILTTTPNRPFTLIIDGIIGAGKSTLINLGLLPILRQRGWRVTFIKEPAADSGELLRRFYTDTSRWAYHFQTMAFHDRVREFNNMYDAHHATTDIFISERSVMSDVFFMKTLHELGHIDEQEWNDYLKWWNMWHKIVPMRPNLFVYLDPDVDEAMNRVKVRNRPGEEGIESNYQHLLKSKHDEVFTQEFVQVTPDHTAEIMHMKTNVDFKSDEGELVKIVDSIEERIKAMINAGY